MYRYDDSQSTSTHSWLALVALVGLAIAPACGSDNKGPEKVLSQPSKQGDRGESCLASNDCKGELVCVDKECVTKKYNVTPTAKHCVRIECTAQKDCCDMSTSDCRELQSNCSQGDTKACQDFHTQCCNNKTCRDDRCVTAPAPCDSNNAQCPNDLECVSGRCRPTCEDDAECPGDFICLNGHCKEGCRKASDCLATPQSTPPGRSKAFYACQNNECTYTGCQSDRACVLETSNGEAVCQNGECRVPCNYDAECNQGGGPNFEICKDGFCVFAGCENNAECRAYLDDVTGNADVQAVCRQPQ